MNVPISYPAIGNTILVKKRHSLSNVLATPRLSYVTPPGSVLGVNCLVVRSQYYGKLSQLKQMDSSFKSVTAYYQLSRRRKQCRTKLTRQTQVACPVHAVARQ